MAEYRKFLTMPRAWHKQLCKGDLSWDYQTCWFGFVIQIQPGWQKQANNYPCWPEAAMTIVGWKVSFSSSLPWCVLCLQLLIRQRAVTPGWGGVVSCCSFLQKEHEVCGGSVETQTDPILALSSGSFLSHLPVKLASSSSFSLQQSSSTPGFSVGSAKMKL